MQLMPGTWSEMREQLRLGSDPFDVHDNMLAGTAYLRDLHDRYGWPGALAAYNAGPGRYELYRSAGVLLPPETRAYLARFAAVQRNVDAFASTPADDRKRVEWARAPLFVVDPNVSSAQPPLRTEGNSAAANAHNEGRDSAARTVTEMFVGTRSLAANAPSNGIFVALSR